MQETQEERKVIPGVGSNYEALLMKKFGRVFIAEGKCWDDTDTDEETKICNFNLMAHSRDEEPSSSLVPSTLVMTAFDYK